MQPDKLAKTTKSHNKKRPTPRTPRGPRRRSSNPSLVSATSGQAEQTLLEAAETINSSLESSSLDTIILAEATRLVAAQRSALLVTEGRRARRPGDIRPQRPMPELFVVPLEDSLFGHAVLSGDTVVVDDVGAGGSARTSSLRGRRAGRSWWRRSRAIAPPTAPSPSSTTSRGASARTRRRWCARSRSRPRSRSTTGGSCRRRTGWRCATA